MKKRLFILALMIAQMSLLSAAEQFVVFTPQADAISLKDATIGYSTQEYEGVKIAIKNLQADFQSVLGKAPLLSEGSGEVSILVGTIGKNADIDRLKLKDLKGKREKFIITTINNQIVIAGSDKRALVLLG